MFHAPITQQHIKKKTVQKLINSVSTNFVTSPAKTEGVDNFQC